MKLLNLAASWESIIKGGRRGPVHTYCVRCTITVRHAPWYQFPASNGVLHLRAGTLELGVQSAVKTRSFKQALLVRRRRYTLFKSW